MKLPWKWIGIVGAIFLGGVVSTAVFSKTMQYTNTTEFCISCHEMKSPVYEEYKKSGHYANRTGVQAGCSDCHVPKNDFFALMKRKLFAANDVYQHILGTVDTLEKFEARRLLLAKRVWESMKETDSRECRSCHTQAAMDFDRQKQRSAGQHVSAREKGMTCIDCHKGITHKPIHKELEREQEKDQDFDLSDSRHTKAGRNSGA